MTSIQIITWNIERQAPSSSRARIMMERIMSLSPDVVCLTEAFEGSTAAFGGHEISVRGVAWSQELPGERKVVLWSRRPWIERSLVDGGVLENGAFASATTTTPVGDVRVVGVCIPYHFASPYGLIPRAKPWSEHLLFLGGLKAAIAAGMSERPMIVLGDFNQFVPRIWGSKAASVSLTEALGGLTTCTDGLIEEVGRPAIDHIALGPEFEVLGRFGIDEHDERGKELSDHFGVAVRARIRHPQA